MTEHPEHRNTTYSVEIVTVHPIDHEVAMIGLCVQALQLLDAPAAVRAVRYLTEMFGEVDG